MLFKALRGFIIGLHSHFNIFQKVLIANAVIIVVGSLGGAYLTQTVLRTREMDYAFYVIFVVTGIWASIFVNYIVLKVAFNPLFALRATMEEVRAGDFQARAEEITGDPDVRRLAQTLNLMLDRMESHRKSVASQILRALEEERKRIARELHDETSQSLTTLIIKLERSLALLGSERDEGWGPEREALGSQLRNIRDLTVETLEEIRRLTFDLRPTILDDLGLIPALRWYVKNKIEPLGIDVELKVYGFKRRLPGDLETALFRIVQEALTNIIRHAEAKNAAIELGQRRGQIQVTVEDDGKGFPAQKILQTDPKDRGMGLFGMEERANLVGGVLEIFSQPGRGTRLRVKIPFIGEAESQREPDPLS